MSLFRHKLYLAVILGYIFGTGAFATWAIGNMADLWNLNPVIQAGTGVGIVAALLAFVLPATREAPIPRLKLRPYNLATPASSTYV
jgi:hypothetical protein